MKILFYMGHPAHFHLLKHVIQRVVEQGHIASIVIQKKDVLESLLDREGLSYRNILPRGRAGGHAGMVGGLAKRLSRLFIECVRNRPDLLVGTSVEAPLVGSCLRIPSVNLNEDDWDAVPLYAKLSYPFSTVILAPVSCPTGRWEKKTIHYEGYHELAYLHPNLFTASMEGLNAIVPDDRPFFILRFSSLAAHHDAGKRGLSVEIATRLIEVLNPHGEVIITSEGEIDPRLERYRSRIAPERMHDALAFSALFIGDSQTMTAESAVLGTPALRFNDFVGRLGYLDELEQKYQLTFGFTPDRPEDLLAKTRDLLTSGNYARRTWRERQQRMLKEKIDTAGFLTWFLTNFPRSLAEAKQDSGVMERFL